MAGSVELSIWVAGKNAMTYDPITQAKEKIQCTKFELLGQFGVDCKLGSPIGLRDYGEGIKVTKRIDATSTQLIEMFINRSGLKAQFELRGPDTDGEKDPEQTIMRITIGDTDRGDRPSAWLRSYRLVVPDTELAAADTPQEPYEELVFCFGLIRYERTGVNNQSTAVQTGVVDRLGAARTGC